MKTFHFVFLALCLMCSVISCNITGKSDSTLEGQSDFEQPETTPFTLPEAQAIKWKTLAPDSLPKPITLDFDLKKLPSYSFKINSFDPLKKAPRVQKLDWNNLPTVPLDLATLPAKKIKVKKIKLPEPKIIPATGPNLYLRTNASLMKISQIEGLPESKVFAIVEDNDGAAWISTNRGLVKYTGTEFHLYETLLPKDPALLNVYLDLLLDEKGRLIASQTTAGIVRIDLTAGIVEQFDILETPYRMAFDDKGLLWGGRNLAGGTCVIDLDQKTVRIIPIITPSHPGTVSFGAWCDTENNIWIGLFDGIAIIPSDRKSIKFIREEQGLKIQGAHRFAADAAGRTWIIAFSNGANAVSLKDQTLTYLGPEQGFYGSVIESFSDAQDRQWFMSNDTLQVLDFAASTMKKIPTKATLHLADYPTSGMKARDGTLWLGTDKEGILLLHPSGLLSEYNNVETGLSSNNFWGINEDSEGRIWLGTFSGLQIYDPKIGKVSMLDYPPSVERILFRSINKIGEDHFLISANRGFAILDVKQSRLSFYNTEKTKVSSAIFATTVDNQGKIWLAGTGGVMMVDLANNIVKKLDESNGLGTSGAWEIMKDKNGRIWVLTDNGLRIIDAVKNTMISIQKEDGITNNFTYSILQHSNGDVFLGTEDGLTIFNPELTRITKITSKNGLPDPALFSMIEINGRVHMGSENGMIIMEKGKNNSWNYFSYAQSAGLPYNDYNQATAFHSSKGITWWGAVPVLTVNHQNPTIDTLRPITRIQGMSIMDQNTRFWKPSVLNLDSKDTLWVNNTPWTAGNMPSDSGYLKSNRIHWDSVRTGYQLPVGLKLPHDINSFSFTFLNPGIWAKDQTVYRYMLEGEEKTWSKSSTKTTSRNYYNISPGNYTFKVMSKGHTGVWSEPAEIAFTISPPWWNTWWAYIIYAVIAGLIIQLIVKFRSNLLEKENRQLEAKVKERTTALNQKMEELKSAQSQLIQSEKMASLGELTAGIAHEIQNPLNFVNNFSEVSKELLDEMKIEIEKGNVEEAQELAENVIQNLEKINHHGKRADSIVKGMLQHSRSNTGTREPVNINVLVDEYVRLAYHGLRAKDKSFNANLYTDFDESIGTVKIVGQDIGRVVLNLITNAFYAVNDKKKNSTQPYEPTVTVRTVSTSAGIKITIADNGKGIPEAIISKIFQPFYTTKPTGQGTGLGLSLAYDIVKAHGGDLRVETEEGLGSTFTIDLPLSQ